MRTRHPWRLALALWLVLLALAALSAVFPAAEAVLYAPERLLGVPARFAERPDALAGPFPPTLPTPEGTVSYPVVVPVIAAFAFAHFSRHARLSYWLALVLFATFPFVSVLLGHASAVPRAVPEALGWGAGIGAIAGLLAGPRKRGTMRRAEAAPIMGLLGLGALALWPVAHYAPAAFPVAAGLYALSGAAVAWLAGTRWREYAVAAAGGSGGAFGLALAAEMTGALIPVAGAWGGAVAALVLAPLWAAAAVAGAATGKRDARAKVRRVVT